MISKANPTTSGAQKRLSHSKVKSWRDIVVELMTLTSLEGITEELLTIQEKIALELVLKGLGGDLPSLRLIQEITEGKTPINKEKPMLREEINNTDDEIIVVLPDTVVRKQMESNGDR